MLATNLLPVLTVFCYSGSGGNVEPYAKTPTLLPALVDYKPSHITILIAGINKESAGRESPADSKGWGNDPTRQRVGARHKQLHATVGSASSFGFFVKMVSSVVLASVAVESLPRWKMSLPVPPVKVFTPA